MKSIIDTTIAVEQTVPKVIEEVEIHPLQLTSAEVATFTRPQRERRIIDLIERAGDIVQMGIEQHFVKHVQAGRVILFSGGDDSTTLAYLLKDVATHAAHANTTIGIEETRQYVRDTCAGWNLPLIEKFPPEGKRYRDLVLGNVYAKSRKTGEWVRAWPGGFPGPGQHYVTYQRLKERCMEQVRNDLIDNPRKERVIFFAGRRRDESKRRADIPLLERRGSTVWISPIAEWTKLDLNTFRLMQGDVPRNPVSALLHMSGECLCGCFAKQYELEQIAQWFPATAAYIMGLEAEIADRDDIPEEYKKWGWGAWRDTDPALMDAYRAKLGPMCNACKVA